MTTAKTVSTSTSVKPVGVLSIRKSKSCAGNDGVAYSCDLYEDDFLIAHVTQDGRGGATLFRWIDWRRDEERLQAHARTLPPKAYGDGESYPMDLDGLVAELCDKVDEQKRLKRLCRTNIVFTLSDKKGECYSVKVADSPEARARIVAKHAGKVVTFVNDEFAAVPVATAKPTETPAAPVAPPPRVSADDRRRAAMFKTRMVATLQAFRDYEPEIRRALVSAGHGSGPLAAVTDAVRALAGG